MLSPQPLATTLLNGPMGPVDTSTNHQQQLDRDTPGTSAPDGMSKRPRLCQDALGREQSAQSACGFPANDCEASAKVLAGRLAEALSPQMRHACRGMAQVGADAGMQGSAWGTAVLLGFVCVGGVMGLQLAGACLLLPTQALADEDGLHQAVSLLLSLAQTARRK